MLEIILVAGEADITVEAEGHIAMTVAAVAEVVLLFLLITHWCNMQLEAQVAMEVALDLQLAVVVAVPLAALAVQAARQSAIQVHFRMAVLLVL